MLHFTILESGEVKEFEITWDIEHDRKRGNLRGSSSMSTPRERVLQAMELSIPDQVPLMCQLSIGHMLLQLDVSPVEFWCDGDVFAEGLCTLRKLYDFDGVLVSLHGHDPDWRDHVISRRLVEEGEEVVWDDGTKYLYLRHDLPQPRELAESHLALSEVDSASLPAALQYIPVSQGLRFKIRQEHSFDIFENVRSRLGPHFSLHGEVTSPFDYYLDLVGHQAGLLGLLLEPEKARTLLEYFTRHVRDLAVKMCNQDIDAIKVSSPFAGATFISPDLYREFVLPYEGQIASAVRGSGVHIYTHTCGKIGDRLELLLEAGVSGIECLDPPPLGDVELADAKRRIGRKGFIKGNIDSVNTLLHGTSEAILADARKRIEIGREGGGFILSTACSVAPHVERGHLQLLREAVERWGR